MAELNLRTDWIADDVVKVEWNDTWKVSSSNGAMALAVIAAFGVFVVAAFLSLSTGGMGFFVIGFPLALGIALFAIYASFTNAQSLAVDPEGLHKDGQTFPLQDISRIEYGARSKWTGNTPQQGQSDPTQIRLWLRDSANHVLSENNWETQINHRIRDEIDAAILAIRKMDAEERHEEEHGKAGDFGMPDY